MLRRGLALQLIAANAAATDNPWFKRWTNCSGVAVDVDAAAGTSMSPEIRRCPD